MNPVSVLAVSAVSALGRGRAAFACGDVGAPAPVAIVHDAELAAAGLRRPFAARVSASLIGEAQVDPDQPGLDPDRATRLLGLAVSDLARALDARSGEWRNRRIGYAIGTSGGAMDGLRRALAGLQSGSIPEADARAAPYYAPLTALEHLPPPVPGFRTQVLAACASATVAIGLGCRWLDLGLLDLVIAGGYDALSGFIAAGFEALGATSASLPAPFRVERDGMALGEGAALMALSRSADDDGLVEPPIGRIVGFGLSCDAVHVTAPDRTGQGLLRAASAALSDAGIGPERIDLVSAHATATPFNDAAEARAIRGVLGERAGRVAVHPYKASIGHTLGAAGALETLSVLDAMSAGTLPAAAGRGAIDPDFRGVLLERSIEAPTGCALKFSAAFGGANAALVLCSGKVPVAHSTPRRARAVRVAAVGRHRDRLDPEALGMLAAAHEAKLSRLDPLSEAAVAAVADVFRQCPPAHALATVGVVVGTIAATIEDDDRFDARLRARGLRAAEPRRFPSTSPNVCAGQCAIVFGLTGPAFAVGASAAAPIEALLVAHDLIASGDADEIVVVAAEEVGSIAQRLYVAAGWPVPRSGALAVLLSAERGELLDREALVTHHSQSARTAEPGWPALLAAVRNRPT